ncbi:ABC transporter ATP-binding protein [Nostoc sp. CMAA1605]|uniref:ABC transporter ATP-binding protein n=1 Tax=Nostoc sp. CMAA1605 TaxID=2055159 RepID=UPI001EEAC170|nr:nitrate ABC transporter ATP-binding protein [Nostoc sp. CMAA1605]MCF4968713.1 bacitracin ABC transporter ATP-binding protein [Nostoc sp. CMAA1605]
MQNFVAIHGVNKEYPAPNGEKNSILKDIYLEIQQGDFISLIGHSGCGKSTLLNIISGMEKASSGYVEVDGTRVKKPGAERMMVFQNYSLLPWLSAWDNVALAVDKVLSHKPKVERDRIVSTHLEMVGLKDAVRKKPGQLSGGMKQRVALARALAIKPKLLLLDEPFGALDALTRKSLQAELMQICNQAHITTIMVTHDVDEALLLSDRVVMLTNGPAAHIGQIVDIPFGRSRVPSEIIDHPLYHELRHELLNFLHHQQQVQYQEAEKIPSLKSVA